MFSTLRLGAGPGGQVAAAQAPVRVLRSSEPLHLTSGARHGLTTSHRAASKPMEERTRVSTFRQTRADQSRYRAEREPIVAPLLSTCMQAWWFTTARESGQDYRPTGPSPRRVPCCGSQPGGVVPGLLPHSTAGADSGACGAPASRLWSGAGALSSSMGMLKPCRC